MSDIDARRDEREDGGRLRAAVPSMPETERAVLGFCLLESTTERWRHITDICGIESPVDLFYRSTYRIVAEAMEALLEQDESVTINAVADRLVNRGFEELGSDSKPVEQFLFDVSLDVSLATVPDTDQAVAKLKESFQRRNLITALEQQLDMASDTDISLTTLSSALSDASVEALAAGTRHLQDFGGLFDDVMFSPSATFSVPSGFPTIDREIGSGVVSEDEASAGGFASGRTYVIAAGPGVGKTTTMFRFIREAVYHDVIPLVYSLESSDADILSKLVSGESNALFKQVMHSFETQDAEFSAVDEDRRPAVLEAVEKFREKTIKIVGKDDFVNGIHDIPGAVMSIRNEVGDPNAKVMVFIDYLQLLVTDSEKEKQQLTDIAQGLHDMAQSLDVPIVELSQFTKIEKGVRPSVRQLYGSGAIEKAADAVMLMWRPGEQENREDGEGDEYSDIDNPNVMMIDIAKNRIGGKPVIETWMDHSRCIAEEPMAEEMDQLIAEAEKHANSGSSGRADDSPQTSGGRRRSGGGVRPVSSDDSGSSGDDARSSGSEGGRGRRNAQGGSTRGGSEGRGGGASDGKDGSTRGGRRSGNTRGSRRRKKSDGGELDGIG